jgi:salicylate hydroxylase
MPPQGESTGLAIEDSVLLARVFQKLPDKPIQEIFKAYEKTRRPRINASYIEAVARWERVHDKSWLIQKMEEWLTWAYLWYKADTFEKSFSYDVRKEDIVQ